jgi:hypothetical protein
MSRLGILNSDKEEGSGETCPARVSRIQLGGGYIWHDMSFW